MTALLTHLASLVAGGLVSFALCKREIRRARWAASVARWEAIGERERADVWEDIASRRADLIATLKAASPATSEAVSPRGSRGQPNKRPVRL